VSTILLPFLLNSVELQITWLAAPPLSVAAQQGTNLPLVVGGLVLLLIVVLVLFWRISRKPRTAPPAQSEKPGAPPSIIVPPPPQAVALSLEFITESGQYIRFALDKPAVTIGRAGDNDIVLTAPILNVDTASQHHARLRRDQEDYIVRDLGSQNGLAVNGRQTIENLLQDGDRLQFGEVEAIFHQSAGGAA